MSKYLTKVKYPDFNNTCMEEIEEWTKQLADLAKEIQERTITYDECDYCGGDGVDYFGFDCDDCLKTGKFSIKQKIQKLKSFV